MQVRAIVSFADAKYGIFAKGSVFDMPRDVDWIRAKFAEPVGDDSGAIAADPLGAAPTATRGKTGDA
jgi:hypothetical protein